MPFDVVRQDYGATARTPPVRADRGQRSGSLASRLQAGPFV